MSDGEAVRRWVAGSQRPTAIDLFCGAGGLSLGLQDAGFAVLVGADSDPASVESHSANLGSLGYLGDLSDADRFLRQLREWGIARVDLVAGGVPCQPFSRAGRSKIRSLVDQGRRPTVDPRAGLWRSFVEVVRGLRPRAVLLENVPELMAWGDGAVVAGVCASLEDLGYRTDARILNAYDFGVPQHRARLIIVATRLGDLFAWPREYGTATVRDAIGDLPPVPPAHQDERTHYRSPQSRLQIRMRRDVPVEDRDWVYDHVTRDVRPDDAEAFAHLREGQTYADLPHHLQRYRTDIFTDKYKRLTWDALSRSITAHIAKDGYWYIHPDQHRTLSIREAARIQTFPDWFRFAGRSTSQYRQIGNAVPPLLAEAIGRELIPVVARLNETRRSEGPAIPFRGALLSWHATSSRQLPWRSSGDVWQVLVGEQMLRRSRRVDTAMHGELVRAVRGPSSQGAAALVARRQMHQPGVQRAVTELEAIAEVIVREHGGIVPTTEEQLRTLPHVGASLASAVIAYGVGRPTVIIDTGNARVAGRLRGEVVGRWQARLDLQRLAGASGPDPSFNAALSDLAALVCRPEPQCSRCPVSRFCASAPSSGSEAAAADDPARVA
jgi:DNA (cytosine-5)-methyltransferase 1